MTIDLVDYLEPIKRFRVTNLFLLKFGRGIPAYKPIANAIINIINEEKGTALEEV